MTKIVSLIRDELIACVDPEKAEVYPRFFKAGPGQYGEGDKFLGVTVPSCRKVAKQYSDKLTLVDIQDLLNSEWHEVRLVALLILTHMFERAGHDMRKQIFDLYLANTGRVNNWDLVDQSAPRIVGRYTFDHAYQQSVLDRLATSDLLWDRRIAVISTLYFIIQGDPRVTLRIVEKLLTDKHDLIQKANGWMLRELGKRIDSAMLVEFIKQNYDQMPRTTLRYAIEHFSLDMRKRYLAGEF